mmetsp:Transcript_9092/g.16547  ORF Transcript_9092/g.16547 Transcript_9092/m.16547 type:complete len:271 (-) Transcript_9092:820-1632(-)
MNHRDQRRTADDRAPSPWVPAGIQGGALEKAPFYVECPCGATYAPGAQLPVVATKDTPFPCELMPALLRLVWHALPGAHLRGVCAWPHRLSGAKMPLTYKSLIPRSDGEWVRGVPLDERGHRVIHGKYHGTPNKDIVDDGVPAKGFPDNPVSPLNQHGVSHVRERIQQVFANTLRGAGATEGVMDTNTSDYRWTSIAAGMSGSSTHFSINSYVPLESRKARICPVIPRTGSLRSLRAALGPRRRRCPPSSKLRRPFSRCCPPFELGDDAP